jgi:environmental stress-induced protein Ves
MPWRNGQGMTREIAREPAAGENFLWRLSIAEIAASCDFSLFPGYDRTIALIEGAGMLLEFAEAPTRCIERCFGPSSSVATGAAAAACSRVLCGISI